MPSSQQNQPSKSKIIDDHVNLEGISKLKSLTELYALPLTHIQHTSELTGLPNLRSLAITRELNTPDTIKSLPSSVDTIRFLPEWTGYGRQADAKLDLLSACLLAIKDRLPHLKALYVNTYWLKDDSIRVLPTLTSLERLELFLQIPVQ